MLQDQRGFTLLELLITMSIIGILVSIAVPKFADYKARAFDTRASSDLRNVALAEEAYFIDNESYLSCQGGNCNVLPGIKGLSQGVTLSLVATPSGFTGTATHSKGTGKIFVWNSENGGLQ